MGREQCELWLELQCVIKGIEKTGLARVCAWAPVVSDKGHRKNWVLLGRPVKVKLMNYVFFFLFKSPSRWWTRKSFIFLAFQGEGNEDVIAWSHRDKRGFLIFISNDSTLDLPSSEISIAKGFYALLLFLFFCACILSGCFILFVNVEWPSVLAPWNVPGKSWSRHIRLLTFPRAFWPPSGNNPTVA